MLRSINMVRSEHTQASCVDTKLVWAFADLTSDEYFIVMGATWSSFD